MVNYGRRGHSVNMSQYISNLNEIPQDVSPEESGHTLEEELAMFTNNNFVDWDAQQGNTSGNNSNNNSGSGNRNHSQASSISLDLDGQSTTAAATPAASAPETSGPDALASGELGSFDFNIGKFMTNLFFPLFVFAVIFKKDLVFLKISFSRYSHLFHLFHLSFCFYGTTTSHDSNFLHFATSRSKWGNRCDEWRPFLASVACCSLLQNSTFQLI